MNKLNYSNLDLIAPRSFWDTPKEEIDNIVNGCGPRKKDFLIPNKILGISILEACRIHDWEYYLGETKEDKKIADFNFLVNMLEINYKRSKRKFLRHIRDYFLFHYFMAVYYYGESSFFNKKDQ